MDVIDVLYRSRLVSELVVVVYGWMGRWSRDWTDHCSLLTLWVQQ